jgi:hypothetical protein
MGNKQLQPPDLNAVLNELKTDILKSINCVQVGIVQSFDAADQTVSVRLSIKKIIEIEDDGTRIVEERPVLAKLPLMILSGGDTFLSFPIAAGDECLVFFNDREIDNWFISGDVQAPTSARLHDLSDGFALVGVRSLQKSLAGYLTNGIRLAHSTAKMDILADAFQFLATLFRLTGSMEISSNLTVENDATVEGDYFVDGIFSMKEATAPTSTPTDSFSLYADDEGGDKVPHFRTNDGDVVKLFKAAHVADPAGGVAGITFFAAHRTAIIAILDILENNGLMAP